ncbi:MAG: lipopolysaccharide biosynthesis protein, partial [Longimicrobiales bacterium]
SFAGMGTHTLIYGFGILLSRAVSFLLLPIYTRFLTPADYGIIALIDMTLDVFAILAGAQLALGVFRFYHKAETEPDRNAVVSTALVSLGISYAAVGAIGFAMSPYLADWILGSQENVHLFRIASVGLALGSLMTVPMAYARVRDLSRFFVVVNLAKLLIAATLNIWFLVGMGLGPLAVFLSSAITNGLVGIWLTIWVVRRVGFRISRDATKDLFRYGVPLLGMSAATFVATFGDRFFIQAHWDEAVVGIYNLGYQFGFLVAMIGFIPFEQVWAPKRFEVARRSDRDSIYARTFIYVNLVLVTLAVGISVYVHDVLRIMAEASFWPAADFVPLIVLAYVFQCWASVQDIGILVRERTVYLAAANWVAAGVAILGYWALIPRWGIWGASYATLLAFFCRWALTYWLSQRLWRVRYSWWPVLQLSMLGAATVFLAVRFSPEPFLSSVGFRSAMVGLYFVAVWYSGILTRTEKATLLSMARGVVGQLAVLARRRGGASQSS